MPAEWETLLGVQWPTDRCDQSGECCRGAAQVAPWSRILVAAAGGDAEARAFLSQYVPYPDRAQAMQAAPDGVAASEAVAASRGDDPAALVFYRCRYLEGRNRCRVYEDRPQLCRDFPESPFGAVPACCGYAAIARSCRDRLADLRRELAALKNLQSMLQSQQPPPGRPDA